MNLIRLISLVIACLFASTASVWAQISAPATTTAVAEDRSSPLPEAPSAVYKSSPQPAAKAPVLGAEARDRRFILANGLMISSSIANVELTTRCLNSGACSAVPGPLRNRAALYGVGLPVDFAVAVIGYHLRRSGHRWWFVPATVVTTGNIIYGIHAAHYIH